MTTDDYGKCRICQKPLLPGQAFYMGRDHYDCHQSKKRSEVERFLDGIKTLSEAKAYIRKLLSAGPFG